jgi:hypothetical protein
VVFLAELGGRVDLVAVVLFVLYKGRKEGRKEGRAT